MIIIHWNWGYTSCLDKPISFHLRNIIRYGHMVWLTSPKTSGAKLNRREDHPIHSRATCLPPNTVGFFLSLYPNGMRLAVDYRWFNSLMLFLLYLTRYLDTMSIHFLFLDLKTTTCCSFTHSTALVNFRSGLRLWSLHLHRLGKMMNHWWTTRFGTSFLH